MVTAAELTTSFLTGALGATVTDVVATPVGTGQVAESARLELTYAEPGSGPATVVAKLPSEDPTSRSTSQAMQSYLIETSFYRDLAPTLRVRAPRCHHVSYEPATDDFVLLLEDLAPAEQGDQITGCGVDVAALAVEHLPELHAPRWGDPALHQLEWLARINPGRVAFAGPMYLMLLDAFEQRYDGRVDQVILDLARRTLGRMPAVSLEDPASWTVQHGDYRLDNLLFGTPAGGPAIAVVDWQTVVLGPGVADVSYFLGAGLSTEDRRVHEEALVRSYHQAMVANGVGLDWDACWLQYRQHTLAGLAMAIGAAVMVGQTDRGDEMFLTMARRHGAHALDLDVESVLP